MSQVLNNIRRHAHAQSQGHGQVQKATANAAQGMTFPVMLKKWEREIARALPAHINPERMCRIALTAFRCTPALKDCDPASIFAAVIQSSQLGLEVGLSGEGHLVPFKDWSSNAMKCQLIPGYQGLMKLARNSGQVSDIYAHEVRQNDAFDVQYGLDRQLKHVPLKEFGFPASDLARGQVTGFYAVAKFKDGTSTFVAMSRYDVEAIRDESKGYLAAKRYKKDSAWDSKFVSMGLKTAIRRLCKFLPKSPELAAALALDAAAESGRDQGFDLDDVIDGVFAPVDRPDALPEVTADVQPQGNGPQGSDPAVNPLKPSPVLDPLASVVAAFGRASTVAELDAVFLHHENLVNDQQLVAMNRLYSEHKERISRRPQASLV